MENEIIESTDEENPIEKSLSITNASKAYLLEITKWSKLFAILGFLFCILLLLFSLFMGSIAQLFSSFAGMATIEGQPNPMNAVGNGLSAFFVVIYLILAALYFFPSYYLYKFANAMKIGLMTDDTSRAEEGFKNLKSVFKFWGITTVLLLAFYAFSLVVTVSSALFL